MPSLTDTAYPHLAPHPTTKTLAQLYTPTDEDKQFAQQNTRTPSNYLGCLILLKTFERLGYGVAISTVPQPIMDHIASCAQLKTLTPNWQSYDQSKARKRHLVMVRDYCQIAPYYQQGKAVMEATVTEAVKTKHDLVDLINIAIEALSNRRIELPGFTTLERTARQIRNTVTSQYYQQVSQSLSSADKTQIQRLFTQQPHQSTTLWDRLKQEPGQPILSNLKHWVERLHWLQSFPIPQTALASIPRVKVLYFAADAQTLDAGRMKELDNPKRYTFVMALLSVQLTRALDDLAELFIKRMRQLHHNAKEALTAYRQENQTRTDELISTLKAVVIAYQSEGEIPDRFSAIEQVVGEQAPQLLEQCDAHLAYVGDNYLPFLLPLYRSHRAAFFRLLEVLPLHSTTQDQSLIEAIAFVQAHRPKRKVWIDVVVKDDAQPTTEKQDKPVLTLDWVPTKWWELVTGQKTHLPTPTQVHRMHFEICVFSHLLLELQSGDVYLEGSDEYGNYYAQLISWEDYHASIQAYGDMIHLPVDPEAFVQHVKQQLMDAATTTDQSFLANDKLSYQKGRWVIHKTKPQVLDGVEQLKILIQQRLEPIHILDVLADTETWLHWTRSFGPISGYEAKVDDPIARYVMATFCYGCNLGPSQAARVLSDIDRRQLSRIHHRHISDDTLHQAITELINAYNQFTLPKYWGTGKHASVDGTKWDIYEQNLLAEYHIRYGGYGAIGYYHIADSYIALFSHFIPCGVWEAVYMLDGLLFNQSEIQPDTVHGDTQAQSATVFALAYLLGITLMPRIRRWQQLDFFRPSRNTHYQHIDDLFTQTTNWSFIQRYLPDMLRVALSISVGKFKPSTILRKLGTNSRKNKLFQAFYELGSVLRTRFLLQYINDAELRSTIHAAINKTESFHRFAKWLSFGGDMVGIPSNNRDEMRKRIKYNHLVANCLILHNVVSLTRILHQLHQEGHQFEPDVVASLSPYLTHHVNRFGFYHLDPERQPDPMEFDLSIGLPNPVDPQNDPQKL